MEKVLISLPDHLAARMRAAIPVRQRSKIITYLLEEEIKKRERALYECALAMEKDDNLRKDAEEWDAKLLRDGLGKNDESW